MLTTRVDSYETAPIHIPNSIFLNTCITTNSRRTHRRILQYITVDYKHLEQITTIKESVLEMLKAHPNTDQEKTLTVSLAAGGTTIGNKIEGGFGSSGINIQIYALVNKIFFKDFIKAQDEIFIEIAKVLNRLEIQFAINPVTINNPKQTNPE